MRTQGMRCMLSGLSESGRVGILLLQSKSEKERHGDREYEILAPPLWGGYDGYGGVLLDDSEGVLEVAVQAYLKDRGAQVDNLDHVADLIQHQGPVHATYDEWDERDLSYALVREDVWLAVVELALEDIVQAEDFGDIDGGIISGWDQKLRDGLNSARRGVSAQPDDQLAAEMRHAFTEYGSMPRFFRDFVQELGEAPIPPEIFEAARGVYLVTKMMPCLGIPLVPRMFTIDKSNVSLKKRFYERMAKVCEADLDMDEEG